MNTRAKVLVIEDSATLRDLVLQILLVENYEVRVAVDGEEGLAAVPEFAPDLVLCDISMPKKTGLDVLRALRADPATATLPFIFLTAKAERSDLRLGMDLGADDYLTKPFDTEELLAAVRARLRKQEAVKTATHQANEQRHADLLLSLPHEVRTPLAGILGLAELLIESDFSPEDRRSMVNDILASGRRLERTLTNLMLHLELELAQQSPQRARSFVGQQAASVREAIGAAIKTKSVEYTRAITVGEVSETLAVKLEGPFLQKAVEELLDNALRFSGEHEWVQVDARAEGDAVVIDVSDRGVGMTAEQISRLQAFRQFDRMQLKRQGLGLGIAIVQHLASLNGGGVSFAAGAGGGLVATLRLPRAEAA